ncbi:MAG TPA: alpha-2-macroglobulin family protein [Thermoanaerobaculia bacterium]|nr:alpha-2-macroglobulin family protein [Thermoanaerobaculia bacterium]
MRRSFYPGFVATFLFASATLAAETPLKVTRAAPTGVVSGRVQANEIRVTFSEPMVSLGKIPENLAPSFFKIKPAAIGTFRWAGTTTLIFTPDPKRSLPKATTYTVTIDSSARSIAENVLATPFSFSFTTPVVALVSTVWYRVTGRSDDPLVIALRFNQGVDPAAISAHLKLRSVPHSWDKPVENGAASARLQKTAPEALTQYESKVRAAQAHALATSEVPFAIATTWDKKRFPPKADLVVVKTAGAVAQGSTIEVVVDATAPSKEGNATPGKEQSYSFATEPIFFVEGFECSLRCNPEGYNPLRFRNEVSYQSLLSALSIVDITDPLKETPVSRTKKEKAWPSSARSTAISLQELGIALAPGRRYAVTVAENLRSVDGQTLGYTWLGMLELSQLSAFTSFGGGHGVWEQAGGPLLPYHSRNLKNVTEWVAPLTVNELVPTILRLQQADFSATPSSAERKRDLAPSTNKLQSYGLDMKAALSPQTTGLVWAALRVGNPVAGSQLRVEPPLKSTIVQVTNLGINVKDSPANTLIFVTQLSDAKPVANAKVSIRKADNQIFWQGTTDARGLVKAQKTPLRSEDNWWQFEFVVVAEKDGDIAYVGSDWNEGIQPWAFGQNFDLEEASPLLRGTVVADRGVYKPGEEIHFKAVLRSDTPEGIQLLPKDTAVSIVINDSRDRVIDQRTVTLNQWSSAEWTFTLPAGGSLGFHQATATVGSQKRAVIGGFLVAAYRRPDFRVDVTLAGDPALAGTKVKGLVSGRYLYGAAMAGSAVRWTYSKNVSYEVPSPINDRFPQDTYAFLDNEWESRKRREEGTISTQRAKLTGTGELQLDLATLVKAGVPYRYMLEGEVTDVTRHTIAGRTSFLVHPAPWYIGIKAPPYFAVAKKGVDTEIVAVTPEGVATAGVAVAVSLTRVQWNSVRRAEGNGFYSWQSERKEVPAGKWNITSAAQPVPLHIDVKDGGYYILRAIANDQGGRMASSSTSFYVDGQGYTAWAREDHNRIELVPERKRYKPGDTARIMIKSPWEAATALVTTEREGIRSERQFLLTSTQQTVTVPITESDIPNLFVSVLLVKGRTKPASSDDTSDPGKPAFRLGYTELSVEDSSKRLAVAITADKEEYRPGAKARVSVKTRDFKGLPARAEVTLWAVDYGVLSLTAYQTPDILESVYVPKAIEVLNSDSRQRIVSRRVLTPKGAAEGGGGGSEFGPGNATRKDFRVLAFWLGSLATDQKGEASADVTLPESLTTYRIMAIAGDKSSRFGWGQREIRTSKPLMLTAAFPRFMTLGDTATFGSVVHSQLQNTGSAIVSMRSLDPTLLEIVGDEKKTVALNQSASQEVRFDVIARGIGRARIRTVVTMGSETDSFEDSIPIGLITPSETVAAVGEANPVATESLSVPTGVLPAHGGLQIELASTALAGLNEGIRYLMEYPYKCAEQRASSALALMLVADLGGAFNIAGIDAATTKSGAQSRIREVETFQCSSGGFAFWPGACSTVSPYLTSHIVHVLQRATTLGYTVTPSVLESAYTYLESEMAAPPPTNEAWWPAFTAWESFVVKVLVEGGRNQDGNINRLYGYIDRMPIFAHAFLWDALAAKGEGGKRVEELRRRISNSLTVEAASSHVEELSDPYLLWFWNSNVRTTAIVLGSFVRNSEDALTAQALVRWLMKVRVDGRWENTQENAWALESLVDYYRKFEIAVPAFVATARLGTGSLMTQRFEGRSTSTKSSDVPMAKLIGSASGGALPLTFTRDGAGRLFYTARLTYARGDRTLSAMNQGFVVARSFTVFDAKQSSTSFKAGELVRVNLTFTLPKERRFVAVTDPLPAGLEAVESWFATTATDMGKAPQSEEEGGGDDWLSWFRRGGFDHVERHDDRVELFATRLSEGVHKFSYVARATTSGSFTVPPAHAEEMYEPEIFGRTASAVVEVKR